MLSLIWTPEQLESTEPQILEEFHGFEVIHELSNSTEYLTKYKLWADIEVALTNAPILDKLSLVDYIILKLSLYKGEKLA